MAQRRTGSKAVRHMIPLPPTPDFRLSDKVNVFQQPTALDDINIRMMEMTFSGDRNAMSEVQRRKRAKIACEPCRERKKKCDGNQPCATCRRFDYACYFELTNRKSKRINHVPSPVTPSLAVNPESPVRHIEEALSPEDHRIRSAEANSGSAFVRRLGLKIDPTNAPKLHMFSWNVGRRSEMIDKSVFPLTDILSQTDMKSLTFIYFEKFHPLYGFMNRERLFEQLEARWFAPMATVPYDSVMCGVAALGYLFSQRRATVAEARLVETARLVIEANSASGPPSVDIITALALRVTYLRLTDVPYVAWMASCSLMHMIEEASLHLEPSSQTLLARSPDFCEPDTRRRLYGISQHLHVWMAFDLGRSRVKLQGASSVAPLPKAGDYTTEILSLLSLSESLDPEQSKEPMDLELTLSKVLKNVYLHPASIIAQCNLVLCIYRRLRVSNWNIPSLDLNHMLQMMGKTLVAVRELVAACSPWHGISNVSFQIVCSLLAIDSTDSISRLDDAMQTLHNVASAYDTDVMKEAYRTACMLVVMYHQKREIDLNTLGGIVRNHSAIALSDSDTQVNREVSEPLWIEGLLSDMPGLQALDIDRFLSSEMAWTF